MSEALPQPADTPHADGLDLGFVSMGYAPDVGGIETHTAEVARELLARGHRVHVLCIDPGSDAPFLSVRDEIVDGVGVRRVSYRYQDHRALADLGSRRAANDVVMAWLAGVPTDVVHVHHGSPFSAGVLGAIHDMGRPLCVTLHDYWFLCPRGQMLRVDGVVCERVDHAACAECLGATWPHLMPSTGGELRGPRGAHLGDDEQAARARSEHALEMLALADRLFTPSSAARAVFERCGVPEGRIRLLANGVDTRNLPQAVAALRRAEARRDGVLRVGVLGSAQPSKGVLEFARAALSIETRELSIEVHGPVPDYHGDGTYAAELRALSLADDRLQLRGPYARADLPRVLARLDVVAVPSRWNEVFGLSAREARAAGVPVLASERGGLLDLAGDPGVRLLSSEDFSAWRAALEELLSDRKRLAFVPAPGGRTAHELALELEVHYVDLVRTLLGREPALLFEPGQDRARPRHDAALTERTLAQKVWRFLRGD